MQIALATTGIQIAPGAVLRGSVGPIQRRPAPGSTRSFTRRDEIFGEGAGTGRPSNVVSGAVRTSKLLSGGRRQIDVFHLSGDMLGIGAGEEHRFGAEALTDTTVIAYRRCTLDLSIGKDSAFARQVDAATMCVLERAPSHRVLPGCTTALEMTATPLIDMAERLAGERSPERPLSHADVADNLELTIETVSRPLNQTERQALVELADRRRSIILRDRPPSGTSIPDPSLTRITDDDRLFLQRPYG